MPKLSDDQKPAITKVIAPAVLFWFRWAALATIVTGLIVAYLNGYVHQALILDIGKAVIPVIFIKINYSKIFKCYELIIFLFIKTFIGLPTHNCHSED